MTYATILYFTLHFGDRIDKLFNLFPTLAEHKKHKAQGGLTPYAR